MRIGSLCSGYGGLDAAVQSVLGGRTVWVSDIDRGANKILAHRYPDAPNLGDFTTTDWSTVEPIDVLTAGFPCQPVSHAGRRRGDEDERWLWDDVARAVGELRPGLVVLENVRGLLTAGAGRLFGRVLGSLADLGYDAQWHGLRAADVGAPHGRWRVFIVAHPHDAGRGEQRRPVAARAEQPAAEHPGDSALTLLPTPACNDMGEGKTPDAWDEWTAKMQAAHGNGNGHGKSLSIEAQRLLPTPRASDGPDPSSHGRTWSTTDNNLHTVVKRGEIGHVSAPEGGPGEELRDVREAPDSQEVRQRSTGGQGRLPSEALLLPELREHQAGGDEGRAALAGEEAQGVDLSGLRDDRAPARPPRGPESCEQRPREPHDALCELSSEAALAGGSRGIDWGPYTAAIRRWESVLGRPAPPPTVLSAKGNPQLCPEFVTWLMGLPPGWVTDVPGITRNEALRALGNGVCPPQCAAALRLMLSQAVAA